jgi:hypothetical protein
MVTPMTRLCAWLATAAALTGCHEGVLGLPLGATCGADSSCAEPYRCAFGRCRVYCASDVECSGPCLPAPGPAEGGVCTAADEGGCNDDADCAAGLRCGLDGRCHGSCGDGCPDGQVCFAGLCYTHEPVPATLDAEQVYGDADDQRAYGGPAVSGAVVYVAAEANEIGVSSNGRALVAAFDRTTLAPIWDTEWPSSGAAFTDVVVGDATVYAAGGFDPPECGAVDSGGGPEQKSGLASFDAQGAQQSCASSNYFSYQGNERFHDAIGSGSGGDIAIYVAGEGQESGSEQRMIFAEYDAAGSLRWKRRSPDGSSQIAEQMVELGGLVYVAGEQYHAAAVLVALDPTAVADDPDPETLGAGVLEPLWTQTYAAATPARAMGVATDGTDLYLVGDQPGPVGGVDLFVRKYDAAGTLAWHADWGTAADDEAVAVAVHGRRVYVSATSRGTGAGGADIVLVELDALDGTVLFVTPWGGAADDFAAGSAVDGPDLFVIGHSGSVGAGGTDLVLLHYLVP